MPLNFLNTGYFADKVGIGTDSPITKLQITTPNASTPTSNIFLDIDGSTQVGMGGQIIFGTSTSSNLTSYTARIQGVRSSLDDGSSDLYFQTTHVATSTSPSTKMTILSDGNVGIGTTTPGYELSVNGNIEAGKNVFQDISSRGGFIMRPWGADYLNTQTNVHTGAIKITLPTGAATEDDMIKFTIDIYQYVTNESLSVDVGGYIYRQAGINDSWRNVTAIVNAKSATENYTVRFGDDGTNHCVWIGELNTVWNHPNVICRNFYGGFEVETEDYLNEWDISFEATSFSHVSQTQSNNFPLSSGGVDGGFLPLSAGSSYPLTGDLYLDDGSEASPSIYFKNEDDNFWRYLMETGGDFSIKEGTSTRLTFQAGGNVGIGTTGPQQKLHIVDTDGANIILNSNTGAENNGVWMTEGAAASPYTNGAYVHYDGTNNAFKINTGTTSLTTKLAILRDSGNVGIGITSPVGKLMLNSNWTNNPNGTTDLYIKSASGRNNYDPQVVNTSDLGITYTVSSNTTAGPSTVGLTLYNDDTTVGGFSPMLLFSKRESGDSAYKATMAAIYARSPLGTGDSGSWIDGELIFATAGAATTGAVQRMVINKEGNVGIGNTSPGAKLDVKGDGAEFFLRSLGYSVGRIIPRGQTGTNIDKGLLSLFDTGTEDVRLDTAGNSWFNGGNVGIGITSPGAKLHVAGLGNESVEIKVSGGTTAGNTGSISLSRTDGSGSIIQGAAFLSGGVPIGGIAGGVVGSSNTSAPAFAIQTPNSTNGHIVFKPKGTEKVRIQADGNVGIGTTTPNAKLDIQGTQGQLFSVTDNLSGEIFAVADISGVPIMSVNSNGFIKFGSYSGTNQVGTPTYILGTSATGGVVKVLGSDIPGLDDGPYLPLTAGSTKKLTGTLYIQGTNSTNAESVLLRGITSNDGDWLGSIRTANTGGYNQEMRFYTSNANGTTNENLTLTLRPDQSAILTGSISVGHTAAPTTILDVRGAGTLANFQSTAGYVDCKFINSGATSFLNFTGTGFNIYQNGGSAGNITLSISLTAATFRDDVIVKTALLSNQENIDVDTGTETVASVAIATYTAAFFDFVIKKTTNVRSGTVYACHDGTNVEFTETSTQDLGDTSDVTLSVVISGTNMELQATTTSDDWSIKSLIRAI